MLTYNFPTIPLEIPFYDNLCWLIHFDNIKESNNLDISKLAIKSALFFFIAENMFFSGVIMWNSKYR